MLAALAVAAVGAMPAQAQLPTTPAPLPRSDFQGADGNQDDQGTRIDWQSVAGVRHNPDPNEQDSAFTGGSKEGQPGEWGLTTEAGGVNPSKANIRNAWSAVDQPGADTFLYLAFTREASDGTTYLAFELNHDARLWTNDARARIPCRRTGDILVAYEAQGNDVTVVLQRWITEDTDPETGCATTGRLEDFTGLRPNVDAQAAINAGSITNHLQGGTIGPELFGEASLNLTELLDEAFGDECFEFGSIWMHSRSSNSVDSNMQDYVAPRRTTVRTCSASGTKFFDSNADGTRDEGEPGIPRFMIWADYDDDGMRDRGEPFSISDNRGRYVINDIRPPDGTYTLRERLLRRRRALPVVSGDWICSFPNNDTPGGTGDAPGGRFHCGWGPIDATATPNAEGKDFGNWFPARLTVRKQLEPEDDAGRFVLLVNDEEVIPSAGDGASITLNLAPGVYSVSERPAAGTDGSLYMSTVQCQRDVTRRGRRRSGAVFEDLALSAGQRATCTFYNVRVGFPAIAIQKSGPDVATAGDVLRYRLEVTNPGHVPFPEDAVDVTDPVCNEAPVRTETHGPSNGDDTPGTLDPGDLWIYACSHQTTAGDDCEPTRVDNTGMVVGTADGGTVDDESTISTILLCPDQPNPPEPPEPPGPPGPGPDEPGPVAPPGPRPPNSNAAAVAGVRFRQATDRCIGTRVPRVNFRGTRVASVRIYVNGQLRRGLNMRTLQRRVTPRVTLAPGRYRVSARVTFQHGTGSPPVTLSRVVRICGRQAPPVFTG